MFLRPVSRWTAGILMFVAVTYGIMSRADTEPDRSADAQERRELEELLRKKRRFDRLPPEEQERLRAFHRKLESLPDREALVRVMHAYTDWLQNLRPGERAEVLSLEPDERIAKIRELMQKNAEERLKRYARSSLTSDDARAVAAWLPTIIDSRKQALLDSMERRDSPSSFRMTLQWIQLPTHELPLNESEIDDLKSRLSAKAVAAIDEQPDEETRQKLIKELVSAATISRFRGGGGGVEIDEEKLWEFYSGLDSSTRAYLEGLPSGQMRRELYRQYFLRRRGGRFGRSGS